MNDAPAIREILALYVIAMSSAQRIEAMMVALVIGQGDHSKTEDEELWELAESLFRMTAGQLARRLKLSDEDAAVMRNAVRARNRLVHRFLIDWGIRSRPNHMDSPEMREWAWRELQRMDGAIGDAVAVLSDIRADLGIRPGQTAPPEIRERIHGWFREDR